MCALIDAQTIFGADDVLVVSIGTGEPTAGIPWKDAKNWGLVGWARPLLDIVFEGVSDTVSYQTAQLCPSVDGKPRSFRFQVQLPHLKTAIDDIDDARAATIEKLRGVARELIEKSGAQLDELTTALAPTPRCSVKPA